MQQSYHYYSDLLKNERLPAAILDLDLLNQNLKEIIDRSANRKIRIASKSIRNVEVLKHVLKFSSQFQGVMCFTLEELIFLAEKGFDDLLLAYPDLQHKQLEKIAELIKQGKNITLMADKVAHLKALEDVAYKHSVTIPICVDMDMSSTILGIYFGVYRSSLKTINDIGKFIDVLLTSYKHLKLIGFMGYEAQIAGVGDNEKNQSIKNAVISYLKKKSIKELSKKREEAVKLIEKKLGYKLSFVNGGGTGSIESTIQESCVTEITVGSGIYASHLFDNYQTFKHHPAAFFALQVTRNPLQNIYTAHGGGYIASGTTNESKAPQPYLPEGMKLFKNEGAGEVQTPFTYSGTEKMELGAPVFFRHAKAGELCERFNELIVISNGKIVDRYKTYRGEEKCFL